VVAPPRYRKWPVARDLVLTLAILLLTSGCLMTSSSDPQPRGPLVAQDVVRLDLREPPTREEAGFAEGRNSLILERVGDAIDVELTLPTGVLKTEAFGVVLAGPVGETAGDHAVEVVLNRRLPDLDTVQRELMEEAEVLGLDAAEIRAFVDQVGTPPSASDDRVLTGRSPQGPAIYVEARYDEDEQDWGLNYSFTFPGAA
jgi:hypothetical protein